MTDLHQSSELLGQTQLDRTDEPVPVYYGLSLDAWVKVGILTVLFSAVYWLVLRWLWDKTNPIYGEANWAHAICIPIIGLYYLYINREELLKQPVEPLILGRFTAPTRLWIGAAMATLGVVVWVVAGMQENPVIRIGAVTLFSYGMLIMLLDWGLGTLLFGLGLFVYGMYPGQNQFLQGCAMVLTIFGLVLLLCGWKVMKITWFPIAFLVCGIPWPPLVYSYVASPLQELAAKVAVVTLRFTGVHAFRTGTKINMGGISEPLRTLNVAEACAGLRSLMTFITVGAAVAFLSSRPLWQKLVITASAVPIAIFCNVMRVAGQGLLDHYVSRQLSESFAHQFVGLVMLIPAFFLIMMVGWMLDHLFVEEADDRDHANRNMQPAFAAAVAAPAVMPRSTMRATQQATAASASSSREVMPPRPAVVPPRPGVTPPRPGVTPPRPARNNMPPRPKEGS